MINKFFIKITYILEILIKFLISYQSYLELFLMLKFIFFQKKKIQYYMIRERYGQFIFGFFMSLSTFRNDAIIFYLKKDIIYNGFDTELKKIFTKKNCLFISSEFLYQIIRFFFKNPIAENFNNNYHPTDTLKSKQIYNFNIQKYFNYKKFNTVEEHIKKKFLNNRKKINKIIIIAIKEKEYYSSYQKIFKNYNQSDLEFDQFDNLTNIVKYLCENNYLVIRSGRNLKKTKFKHELFFDYASSKKYNSLSNDLYISSISDYIVGNMTGFDAYFLCWFKKKVFNYQIRSYKFLNHYPNLYFSKMNIKKNKKELNINKQLYFENLLWKSQDQNDLYKAYRANKITISKYSSNDIKKKIIHFLDCNSRKINSNNFYKNYFKYYSLIYKKIGKYQPVFQAKFLKK
jgi:putative glycosyltransferase (TIGR04372 family)